MWLFKFRAQASTVADLEGGPGGPPPPPLFAENLPSNVSKTQDLRPKIRDFIAISGGGGGGGAHVKYSGGMTNVSIPRHS